MATEYRESDLEWEEKDPPVTPTEEKKGEMSDFAAGIIVSIVIVCAVTGGVFLLYHSTTVLGFVFKPWMQVTSVEELREDIKRCADEERESMYIDYKTRLITTSTSTVPLKDCLKNL